MPGPQSILFSAVPQFDAGGPALTQENAMQYVDHLIKQTISQLWPISEEQQQLRATELEHAGATIKHWRICQTNDPAAIDDSIQCLAEIRQREIEATRQMLRLHPITVCIVHDQEYEIAKGELKDKLKRSFELMSQRPVALCTLDIWLVLVAQGEDKFISGTCDSYDLEQKPSTAIVESLECGDVGLRFTGWFSDAKTAISYLKSDGYFNRDD
jgi:hypothetical protein